MQFTGAVIVTIAADAVEIGGRMHSLCVGLPDTAVDCKIRRIRTVLHLRPYHTIKYGAPKIFRALRAQGWGDTVVNGALVLRDNDPSRLQLFKI
jgi:hypothetical protein